MQVRELVTRLGFDADEDQARSYDRALGDIRRNAMRAAVAVTALAGGTFEVARRMANAGNEVAKQAVETGLAADEFQRLTFAIGQVTRLTGEQAQMALMRLNDSIGRARIEGGMYADALERLGFSQEEISSGAIDNSEAFARVVEELGKVETANEAAALGARVLGQRVGRQLGPALRENAEAMMAARREAERLGGGWSDVALTQSEEFMDSMGRVSLITTTITSQIAETLLPAVQAVVDSFVNWWAANRELIQQNIARVIERLAVAMRIIRSVVGGFLDIMRRGIKWIGGMDRAMSLLISTLSALMALRFAKWLWALSGALSAAAAGGWSLRAALQALARVPIIAAMSALVLILEDVYFWLSGGESVLKDFFDTWEQRIEKLDNMMPDWLKSWIGRDQSGVNIESLAGSREVPGVGIPFFGRSPAEDAGNGRQINVNARTEATIQVPFGTPEEQRRAIEAQTRDIFTRHWDNEIRNAMWNMQPVD